MQGGTFPGIIPVWEVFLILKQWYWDVVFRVVWTYFDSTHCCTHFDSARNDTMTHDHRAAELVDIVDDDWRQVCDR